MTLEPGGKGVFMRDGLTLRFEVSGTGMPLLLVHGLVGSTRWWARNIDVFAEHFQVIAVDCPGFGANWTTRPFRIVETVSLLRAFVVHEAFEEFHLIGHSLGGVVGSGLAVAVPDRIDRLVLVDAAFLDASPGVVRRLTGLVREAIRTPRELFPVFLADMGRSGPAALPSAAGQLLRHQWQGFLHQIECPTFVIWGEDDHVVPVSVGRQINNELPRSRLNVIPGVGHVPMWEAPETFNRLVLDFLESDGIGVNQGPES